MMHGPLYIREKIPQSQFLFQIHFNINVSHNNLSPNWSSSFQHTLLLSTVLKLYEYKYEVVSTK